MKPTSVSLWKLCESQANLLCPDRRVTIGTEWGALRLYITNCDGLQDPPGSTETDLTSPPGPLVGDIPQSASTSFEIKQTPQCRSSNLDSLLLITEIHDDSRIATKSGAMDFHPPRYRSITGCGNKDRTQGKDNGIQSISCTDSSASDLMTHGYSATEYKYPPGRVDISYSDEIVIMNTVYLDQGSIDKNERNYRANQLSISEFTAVAIIPEVRPKDGHHQCSNIPAGIHGNQLQNPSFAQF
jgi:hypothetical protein